MPSLTKTRYNELLDKEERLKSLERNRQLEPFGKMFGESLAILAAQTPMAQWPHFFHTAFEHCLAIIPSLGHLYKEVHAEVHSGPNDRTTRATD